MISELIAYWLGRSSGRREGYRRAGAKYPRDKSYYVAQRIAFAMCIICLLILLAAYAIAPG